MRQNNYLAQLFGIIGFLLAVYLGIGILQFKMSEVEKFFPYCVLSFIAMFFVARKIDSNSEKIFQNRGLMRCMVFGITVALIIMFTAIFSGSAILVSSEIIHTEIFGNNLSVHFYKIKNLFSSYMLAPVGAVMFFGFIPAIVFGSMYGAINWKIYKNVF